jgi:hypothetical protein
MVVTVLGLLDLEFLHYTVFLSISPFLLFFLLLIIVVKWSLASKYGISEWEGSYLLIDNCFNAKYRSSRKARIMAVWLQFELFFFFCGTGA